MKSTLQVILILLMISKHATGQTVLTLQPDSAAGMDALIKSDPSSASVNFGNDPEFDAVAWTISGNTVILRSLIRFDLSALPPGNTIYSAYITLSFDSAAVYGGGTHSGTNASYLRKITAPWQENTVNWNNQPATTTSHHQSTATTSGTFNLNLNITDMVNDWYTNPASNYGLMFHLKTEVPNACYLFASSDFPIAVKRPKLDITYSACPLYTFINYVGPLIHCQYETDTLNGPTGPVGYAYQWKKNGSPIPGATSKSYIISSPGAGIWTYTCDLTTNGCTVSSNAIIDTFLAGNQLQPMTLTTPGGVTNLCSGSLVITAPTGFSKYKWLKGTAVVNFSSSNTLTVTQSGDYSCVAFQSNSCDTSNSNLISITGTIVSTTISASPASLPCVGGTSTLSVPNTPGAFYQWYIYNSPLQGQNSYSTSFINHTGQYSCDISIAGCPTFHSATYILTGPPDITYVPPFSSCSGTQLSATPNALTYQWKVNGNNIPFANMPTYQATGFGNYTCQITTANCGSGLSNAIQASFPGAPSPYLTTNPPGTFLCCSGTQVPACSTTTLIAYPPGQSYTWHTPWGVVTGGQTMVTSMSGTYSCDIQYSCGTSSTTLYNVNLIPGNPVSVNFSLLSCNQAIISSSGNVAFHQWRKNGSNISNATGSFYLASTSGYYSALVSNGCGYQLSDSVLVTIPGPPSAQITPDGPITFCSGVDVMLKAPVVSGNTYQWLLNNIQVGTDTAFTVTASGTYKLIVTSNGCTATDSVVVVVINPPLAVITPSGNTTFCSGDSVKLNASTGAGYSWQWLKNGVNINGATSSSYTAKASGSYSVLVSVTCGALSSAVTVTVNAKPAPAITASGPLTFCNGDSVVLSTSNTAGATYQWKKNGNVIAGATLFKYTAKTAGTYKVVKTNTFGCSGTSSGKIVTIDNPTATITPQGPTSFCAGDSVVLMAPNVAGYTYQWKKFNNNIAGASGVSYTAKTQATYKVLVTNSNGCTKLSSGVVITVPCREGETGIESVNELTVYPNPFDGNFTLHMSNVDPDEQLQAFVYDVTGKLIDQLKFKSGTLITGEQLSPGIYEIVVRTADEIKKVRVVKVPVR